MRTRKSCLIECAIMMGFLIAAVGQSYAGGVFVQTERPLLKNSAQEGLALRKNQETAQGKQVLPVTLETITQLALRNNFAIQLARYDAQVSEYDVNKTLAVYDAILSGEISYQNDQSARTNTFGGTKSLQNVYKVGVERRMPTGTTLSLDLTHQRDWTNSIFATTNPAHDSRVAVSIEQDLGRNFFGVNDRREIMLTTQEVFVSHWNSRRRIEKELADIQKAYWDYVLAVVLRDLARDSEEQSRRLWRHNQEQFQVGMVEEPELYAAEAHWLSRQNERLKAESLVKTKETILKILLNVEAADVTFQPQDSLTKEEPLPAYSVLVRDALAHRSDFQQARHAVAAESLKLEISHQNLWPEINLTASLARNGVAADSFTSAFEDIAGDNNPELSAGLTVSLPLGNREAQAEQAQAELKKAQSLLALKALEQRIVLGLRDQFRVCQVAEELARSAQTVADLQRKKLRAEEERFLSGRSDTDTIIRFQEDWTAARTAEARARHEERIAHVELRFQQGALRQAWNEEEEKAISAMNETDPSTLSSLEGHSDHETR